jgi:hypothetical protein
MAAHITRRVVVGSAAVCALLALGIDALAQPTPSAPMKMDEPMSGEMKKKGMKKRDVKSAAEKKEREMKGMIEQEQKSMPQDARKK